MLYWSIIEKLVEFYDSYRMRHKKGCVTGRRSITFVIPTASEGHDVHGIRI